MECNIMPGLLRVIYYQYKYSDRYIEKANVYGIVYVSNILYLLSDTKDKYSYLKPDL